MHFSSRYSKRLRGLYARALEIAQAERETRYEEIFEEGRRYELVHRRKVEWRKLFTIIVTGRVIGCGIIPALAIGLTNLPR